jgi:hypothetical protein
MSWTSAAGQNAWLVLDRNENGTIDDLTEMFGNMTPQPDTTLRNGYLALAVFDDPSQGGDGNGVIDARDAVFGKLRLWIDKNHNGISESGELKRLTDHAIVRISTKYKKSKYVDENGNEFRFRSFVWDSSGREREVSYDVYLQVEAVPQPTIVR